MDATVGKDVLPARQLTEANLNEEEIARVKSTCMLRSEMTNGDTSRGLTSVAAIARIGAQIAVSIKKAMIHRDSRPVTVDL